ncbi:MAG: Rpn family recombination-promoting nuclease/putative transposase [Candidatus Thiosymbion ectosymbiont of Robbea hypermnestra]|nr:Rpn family recombination-promoting nuclease/putative transposase [Candidatus Thiosymbion ectosymbiont of Robbea hypermnestra]
MKELLSYPETAGTLLRERLPEAVVKFLSAKPPELIPSSFVDKELREHLSDRLFKVETINGKTAFLYVLIEHKSTPDNKVGWQLLRYLVEILKQWEKQHRNWDRLPAIVPFVFYHGLDEWKIPDEFLQLVATEESWRPYLLNFRFPVLDLGRVPDRELSQDRRLRARLLAMKYATRKAQQLAIRERLIEALQDAPETLRPVVRYLIHVYCYDERTLRGIIRAVRPEEEETMMSQFAQDIEKRVRQKALQEGIQQGMQQGMQQGIRKGLLEGEAKLLLRILPLRFGPLPDEISERIYNADPNTIELWAERVLDAESLEDVFAK